MAQVTMDGKEYIELVGKNRQLDKERNLLVETLIKGTLICQPGESYRRVYYESEANLPNTTEMYPYAELRKQDVTRQLEESPEALRILYEDGEVSYNPYGNSFGSHLWDDYVAIPSLSTKIKEQWEGLKQEHEEEKEAEQEVENNV